MSRDYSEDALIEKATQDTLEELGLEFLQKSTPLALFCSKVISIANECIELSRPKKIKDVMHRP